jgi:5-methylcytosine-specific restriction endonuclease McrA
MRQYRITHKERNVVVARKWRAAHKSNLKISNRRYCIRHADQIATTHHVYYESHKTERAAYGRKWRGDNKEALAVKKNEYRQAHAAEANLLARRWKASHPREVAASRLKDRLAHPLRYRAWSLAHQKEVAEYHRQYHLTHMDDFRAAIHRRRARVRGNGGSYSAKEWRALCTSWGDKCLCCGKTENPSCDHVIPIALGGMNTIDNLQLLCKPCNCRKGIKTTDYRPQVSLARDIA